ncbi:MAG: iron-containing alcohol dehydrogenase, partial [Candidatus Eremiobacteraeota bacterium]|nr:iron-containing alcohol dehydrogenase [Candidatus Eremiobacteraeota bacterium]
MEATPHAHETVLEVEAPRVKFGRGAIGELGAEAAALGLRRVALFTDRHLAGLDFVERARRSLRDAGVDVAEFSDVRIEPTDASFRAAAAFAADAHPDGYVSVGGGSVIDTAKAANLYATHPAPFERYVNAPLGEGAPVPGPLAPHIACPTTSGTGSECTGIAIFDFVERGVKTGIASRRLRPALGIVDPDATRTLPAAVVASSGFDVLAHALESFTARPYTQRARPASPLARPLSQGANPYSDLACTEALRLLGDHLERAVHDAHDDDAREAVMYAATLAGIGFGNAGVHVPHGMAYAVAGQVHDFVPPGYGADHAMVPHGMSVIVS